MKIDFLIPYRDRDFNRVKNCIDSIQAQSSEFHKLIFVDYGSQLVFSEEVTNYLSHFGNVDYIYSHSQGHLWNRGHALNIGIKSSVADFIIIADIDIIYPSNFVNKVNELISVHEDQIFHYKTLYLDKGELPIEPVEYYIKNRKISEESAKGLAIYPRNLLIEIEGFDEFFCVWGKEDIELSDRIKRQFTLKERWIFEPITFHQWHPTSNVLPYGWYEVMEIHHNQKIKKELFGKLISKEDRNRWEIINQHKLASSEHFVFSFPYEWSYVSLSSRITKLASGEILKIDLIKPELFSIRDFKSRGIRLINEFAEFLSLGYRITDIETYHERSVPFDKVFSYLFFLISQLDLEIYDYRIIQFDVNHRLSVHILKK